MKIKLILAAALTSLAVSGCASTSSGSGDYSNVDPSLTRDEANFFSESGWTACAVGAGLGALACLVRGGDSDDMLLCAAVAIPAGCGIFMGGNYLLDELRVNYKTQEARLDHMADLVKKDNDKLRTLNKSIEECIAKDREELARMERDLTAGTISSDDLHAKINAVDDNIGYLNDSIKVARERLANYESTRDKVLAENESEMSAADREALTALNKQIDDLKAAIAEADACSQEYAQLKNGIHAAAV